MEGDCLCTLFLELVDSLRVAYELRNHYESFGYAVCIPLVRRNVDCKSYTASNETRTKHQVELTL